MSGKKKKKNINEHIFYFLPTGKCDMEIYSD